MTVTQGGPTLIEYYGAIRSELSGAALRKVKDCLASGKWGINFQSGVGHSALHTAAIYGKSEIVGLLACYGADPNLYDSQGHTALHLACKNAHASVSEKYISTIKTLLQCGADPKAETKKAEGC